MRFRVLAVGLAGFSMAMTGWAAGQSTVAKAPKAAQVVYRNAQYDFCFVLPASWKGYTIVPEQWQGNDLDNSQKYSGPKLLIRHPGWTEAKPFEDIPIMIFTPAEWKRIDAEKMAVSAAPIGPEKLASNSKYVFALPARYNFDDLKGADEVDKLVHGHALQAPCKSSR